VRGVRGSTVGGAHTAHARHARFHARFPIVSTGPGAAELVRNAIAVVNAVREEGLVEVDKIEEHFQGRCRAVVQVPWDPHLSAGAETQVD
jgi:hypothetical protein